VLDMAQAHEETGSRSGTSIVEKADDRVREPDMYRVLLHNDHYTTMDFVVEVLRSVFHKSIIEATKIMLDVHRKGVGIVGVFTYDVASTKAAKVSAMAKKREYPLKCTIKKV
jgi:ATP-dependent Clp protease adaptor protein ClpS